MDEPVTPELLERLLLEHGAALELFAAQWTDWPEDCVQEAYLQLVRQRKRPNNLVAWLYRVVRNRAISMRRSAMRRSRHEKAAASDRPTWFTGSNESLVDDQTLTEALQSLSDRHREVIVAKVWSGLSFEQIAEVTGLSRSTAHRCYEAGLRILRERLGLTWLTKNEAPNSSTNSSAN